MLPKRGSESAECGQSLAGGGAKQASLKDFSRFEGITLENCHRSLATWVVVDKRPFNLTSSNRFREFCKRISVGRYPPPAYETLMKHIDGMEINARHLLALCFEDALPGTLTVTFDAWTSE